MEKVMTVRYIDIEIVYLFLCTTDGVNKQMVTHC